MINELMIRVTYKCNKNCDFCFNNIFEDKVNYAAKECLNIDDIKQFVKQNGVEIIYISGGEPTVYKNIRNFTYAMSTVGKVIYFTNGMLFERFTDDEIVDMGISAINISVYTDEIIRSTEIFEKKMSRLSQFKHAYPQIKLNAQVMIDDSFFEVIGSDNYNKHLKKIFDRINWQPLAIPKGHYLYTKTLEGMDKSKCDDILDYLKKEISNEKIESLNKILNGNVNGICLMGKRYITINPDMTINICPHRNDNKLTFEKFDQIKSHIINSNNGCLSMRCVSLQSFLQKKYKDN